ncbi:phospho-sugar mutase [Anaerovorax odorimutans]|uniref:phospho-sugar mutase n=1 Tax=Anaerovorax odorimutans TaxID=109327 RepID=UPI00048491BC|nr:phospho-sugar mutase [Anaerovorax odorimutans]
MKKAIEKFNRWLDYEDLDNNLRSELLLLKNDEEIYEDFYKDLEFGTGGLRGILGAGTNRMNIYTVRRATQGLANYINKHYSKADSENKDNIPSVAIAYDSRINSHLFAMEAAKVLMGNNIKVYLYSQLMPTPALSFAVRYYKCVAGIMVTASHNPAKYNGYKVYNNEGCQMTLKAAAEVYNEIEKIDIFNDVKMGDGQLEMIPNEVTDKYLERVKKESTGPVGCENLSVVYTPLNGTGNLLVRKILHMIGVQKVSIVKEQELPNGNFPTCPYPNPEKKEALELGLSLCKKLGKDADLLLATDPDCDRVGIAVRHTNEGKDELRLITGNEVGILLLDFICQRRIDAKGNYKKMPENPIAMKTIVSSKMADDVARHYEVSMIDVLTGFKFIGEQIGILESKEEDFRFIFGFEESYGYLSGSYVRDKDAVNASMLICEMTAYYKSKGQTLIDRLKELYEQYGYYKNDLIEFMFEGAAGMKEMSDIMNRFKEKLSLQLIGKKIVQIADYQTSVRRILGSSGHCDLAVGTKPIDLPKADVLEYVLEDGSSFIIRPSGTEPKLKVYLSSKGETNEESVYIINEMKKELTEFILKKN